MFEKLSAPFPVEAIHWRAQAVTRNGDKALALAYIDARDGMDRLDEVCGPASWSDTYEETPKGRLICRLSILTPDGNWVMKSDGAGDTDVEGEKGAISDAFKRAGVKWGIGRYLYDLKDVWAPCEAYEVDDRCKKRWKWKAWKPEAEQVFAAALAKVGRPTGLITEKTRDWLTAQLQAASIPPGDLLKAFSPGSLNDFTYEQLPEIQGWLKANRKAA